MFQKNNNQKWTHVLAFFPAWWCDSNPSVNVCNWPILILDKFFWQPNHLTWAKSFVMCTILPGHEDEPLVGPHTKSPSLNSCFGWSESFAISLSASRQSKNNKPTFKIYASITELVYFFTKRKASKWFWGWTSFVQYVWWFPRFVVLMIRSSTHQVNMGLFILVFWKVSHTLMCR